MGLSDGRSGTRFGDLMQDLGLWKTSPTFFHCMRKSLYVLDVGVFWRRVFDEKDIFFFTKIGPFALFPSD